MLGSAMERLRVTAHRAQGNKLHVQRSAVPSRKRLQVVGGMPSARILASQSLHGFLGLITHGKTSSFLF